MTLLSSDQPANKPTPSKANRDEPTTSRPRNSMPHKIKVVNSITRKSKVRISQRARFKR
ncbi:Uncharacterised protein [Vibrio cholerae]|nr:Uncharacterised protein [Vibrio cholerae]